MFDEVATQLQQIELDEIQLNLLISEYDPLICKLSLLEFIAACLGVQDSDVVANRIVYLVSKSETPEYIVFRILHAYNIKNVHPLLILLKDYFSQNCILTRTQHDFIRHYSSLVLNDLANCMGKIDLNKFSPGGLSFEYIMYLRDQVNYRDIVIMFLTNPLRALSEVAQICNVELVSER